MLLSALRVAAATPMVLLCASQFKHFPMSFPSENVLHVELKRYLLFFFDESQDWILLPSSVRPLVDLFKELYKMVRAIDRERAPLLDIGSCKCAGTAPR